MGSDSKKMALKGYCCATRFEPTAKGPIQSRAVADTLRQCCWNQDVETHITALVKPNPNMAKLTTKDPKWAQLPTEKIRMMVICKAITAPAIMPTDKYNAKDPRCVLGKSVLVLGVTCSKYP